MEINIDVWITLNWKYTASDSRAILRGKFIRVPIIVSLIASTHAFFFCAFTILQLSLELRVPYYTIIIVSLIVYGNKYLQKKSRPRYAVPTLKWNWLGRAYSSVFSQQVPNCNGIPLPLTRRYPSWSICSSEIPSMERDCARYVLRSVITR